MKLKFNALVLAASMIAAPAFAADYAVSALDVTATAFDATIVPGIAGTEIAAYAFAGAIYDENVAIIGQVGDNNFAVIDQDSTAGYGNVALINQNNAGVITGQVAFIGQLGNNNFAFINQH